MRRLSAAFVLEISRQARCCFTAVVTWHRCALPYLNALAVLAFVLVHSSASFAQDSTAEKTAGNQAQQPKIIVPKPVQVSVTYPAGETEDAFVVLKFVVTVEGLVKEPEVLEGDEPFASAAIAAAASWRFEPAQRGDRRVPAVLRYVVNFTYVPPPPAVPAAIVSPEPSAAASATPRARVSSAEAVIQRSVEVVVEGERHPGTKSYSTAEAQQIPGAFGDPLRAIDSMAGVSPVVSSLPIFYVRGAPPGNIGTFIDGVRVPILYHAFLGPSVLHPQLIERVNLHPGPYPAKFGRFAGAIVSADLRVPRRELGYGFSLGLFDAGAYAETPFAGERGNIFVGGRYSYAGLIVSSLSANTLEFWNYQALGEFDLTDDDTISVFALGAFDFLQDQTEDFFGTEFHRFDLRYDRRFSAETTSRVAFTTGIDRTQWIDGNLTDLLFAGRFRVRHRLGDNALLAIGASATLDSFEIELASDSRDFQEILDLFSARDDSAVGGYTELTWGVAPGITLIPGARVDLVNSGPDQELTFEPRIAARYRLSDEVTSVHGVGLAHQPPNYVPNVPGARVSGLSGGLQRIIHTTSGIEAELPHDWTLDANVFHNVILDATDPFSSTQSVEIDAEAARDRPVARAYGLELTLKRSLTRRFGGLLTYTLSRSTRTFDNYSTLAGSDRTHVLNLAALYTLGPNWRVGGRSVLYSGVPGRSPLDTTATNIRQFDASRADPFLRLDLRLERRFVVGPRAYWSVVAELQNATFSAETLRRECSNGNSGVVCTDTQVGPIPLPNLRIEGHF